MDRDARYRETARVTIIGAVLDLVLGIAKLLAGYFSYSQALIADGIHSLPDVATDGMVLYAARHSNAGQHEENGNYNAVAHQFIDLFIHYLCSKDYPYKSYDAVFCFRRRFIEKDIFISCFRP